MPPNEYFMPEEYSIFCINTSLNKDNWYTLPGPAKWWEDNYNYKGNGFNINPYYKPAY
jgi:hypothetical protein